jgi:hypothetical protein
MVALQEEMDWLTYSLYGIDVICDAVPLDEVQPCSPTWLPWNRTFAERNAENIAAIANGEEPDEQPSEWWNRHGWKPLLKDSPNVPVEMRARFLDRRLRTEYNPSLALIEQANYKRRWYKPDYVQEEFDAFRQWLVDRVEDAVKKRTEPFTSEQLAVEFMADRRFNAVITAMTRVRLYELSSVIANLLFAESVPNHRFHIYKQSGLDKRAVWERVWDLQRQEDADNTKKIVIDVPPSYSNGDFQKQEHWRLRGKLDVPKERFIAYTEAPGHEAEKTFFGWAGWDTRRRLKAVFDLYLMLNDEKKEKPDLVGVSDSVWLALDKAELEYGEEPLARTRADVMHYVSNQRPQSAEMAEWRGRFPLPVVPIAIRRITDLRQIVKRGMDGVDGIEKASEGFL